MGPPLRPFARIALVKRAAAAAAREAPAAAREGLSTIERTRLGALTSEDVARGSVGAAPSAAVRHLESAFRLPDGRVVRTGGFHDLNQLPEPYSLGEHINDLDVGFATPDRFYTREEAGRLTPGGEAVKMSSLGVPALPYSATMAGAREAPVLSGGAHSDLWLRARAEALRRHAAKVK